MLIVPLQAIPSQTVNIQLGGQSCRIDAYQTAFGLFIDLYVSGVLIIGGVIGQNLNRIVRDLYLGFVGDLTFIDSQGSTDPDYLGLGGRYALAYLTPDELPPGQG
jgi:hypothetical protein